MQNIQTPNKKNQIPQTIEGIKEFLMSIKSIGLRTTNRILYEYKLKSWYIIQDNVGLLGHIKGIGPKRKEAIRKAVFDLLGNDGGDFLKFDN